MAILCSEIEPLVHAYLDGELAEHDLRDFELHVADCAECKSKLDSEIEFRNVLRRRLAPPKAPASLHARIRIAMDEADHTDSVTRRRTGTAWLLPGSAILAAAAALFLFVTTSRTPELEQPAPVANEAVNRHMLRPPVEVQGAASVVTPWIKQHFRPSVSPPRFNSSSVSLRGARLGHLRGRDAAQLFYDVNQNGAHHKVQVHILESSGLDLRARDVRRIGGRDLWIDAKHGYSVVTFKDGAGMGYVFTSDMEPRELVDLVTRSDLLLKMDERIRDR